MTTALPHHPEALRDAAQAVLPPEVFDHIDGGSDAERTRQANSIAWQGRWLRPRVLRAVDASRLEVEVVGQGIPTPILVAPMAAHGLVTRQAELATAAGAADARCGFITSTLSTIPLEAIAEAAAHPRWFQLYVFEDRGWAAELVSRAIAADYGALVLTVDAPGLGHKRRDADRSFLIRRQATYGNLPGGVTEPPDHARNLTPDDVALVVEQAAGRPVLVKGVLRADDAIACVEAGASGVIVSNHGGRQVDGAVTTAHALPEIVEALAGRATILVDGGIQEPSDVVIALALGADAVLIGRPVLWAAAVGGRAGVAEHLSRLVDGVERTLRLAGVASAADVPSDLVVPA